MRTFLFEHELVLPLEVTTT
uniref:Uncharacterized protein n=1 Tax=Rhizophora mucronata TaxID=61149 RepID=A0A2P2NP48_RHIMU